MLDPEQNNTFQDNYLEVPFDLSKVLFITTANLLDPIPAALRDRMEVIQLPGYTQLEKTEIGRRFLIPKQMTNHGLTAKHIEITDEALTELVQAYTHEAGVRNLEREIANSMRKVAKTVAEGRKRKTVIDVKKLDEFLGPPRFEYGELEPEDQVGAATGLVVTETGGDIVAVEVTRMEGKEDFILTGQLGEVMRESARAGLSWTRAHARELGITREVFEKNTLHIHVPAGAIPKDGPSAGITMATAIVSALTGIPVRKDVAMTGEITLRGRVLPDRRVEEQDPRRSPRRRQHGDPAETQREGPSGYPRGDPASDEAGPRRNDGPGTGVGAPAAARGPAGAVPRLAARARARAAGGRRRTECVSADTGHGSQHRALSTGCPATSRSRTPLGGPDGIQGLLRDPGSTTHGEPGRVQEGLPQARAPASPGRKQGKPGGRAAVQGGQRGPCGPQRSREAQGLRHARRELGLVPAGWRGGRGG